MTCKKQSAGIRLILLDIDGTLTNSKKQISPRTKEALLKAQAQGITLALCSGRPDQGLYRWAEELEMTSHGGLFVCYNGGKVINCQTKEVLYNRTIPVPEAKAVLEHVKQFDVVPTVTKGEYMYVTDVFNHDLLLPQPTNILQYEARGNGYLLCEVRDLAEFADYELNKILIYGQPDYLKAHHQEISKPFEDRLNAMFTAPIYYEFTAKNVDKATALHSALSPLGFRPEEMIAFGDAQNDISMLQYAGIGVAMGNAVDAVKECADEITASNDEDGIALSLYKHLPGLYTEDQKNISGRKPCDNERTHRTGKAFHRYVRGNARGAHQSKEAPNEVQQFRS